MERGHETTFFSHKFLVLLIVVRLIICYLQTTILFWVQDLFSKNSHQNSHLSKHILV